MNNYRRAPGFLLPMGVGLLLLTIFLLGVRGGNPARAAAPSPDHPNNRSTPRLFDVEVSDPVTPTITARVRDLPMAIPWHPGDPVQELLRITRAPAEFPAQNPATGRLDPLLTIQANIPQTRAPAGFETPLLNFAGQEYSGVNPPDTVGDVGPDYYIQMINTGNGAQVTIYTKTGSIEQVPFFLDTLGTGSCSNGRGDPIVLYDRPANRWLLSEFAFGNHLCVYISQTPDPTGAYYAYDFPTSEFPDYPKYGVWPDAYYVSTNESVPAVYAMDRAQMLSGGTATYQRFTAPALAGFTAFQALIPSDLDGANPPPGGSPNYFMRHRDDEFHNFGSNDPGRDFLEIWEFRVDFAVPPNSSFTLANTIPVSEFDSNLCGLTSFDCFPQPGTGVRLDPLREVIMWRLQYRNFGTHETLVGNLVTDVDGTDHGGIRWFELRKSGAGAWSLYQEGTYAPDSDHRWLGSIAMDVDGNIALGYSVSSSSTFPSIRYIGRLANDPLGTLPQGEYTLVAGTASNSSNRWGDYSSMNVDPVDDCTFWFTHMYNTSSNWSTRIGSFKLYTCGVDTGTLIGQVTNAFSGLPIEGALIQADDGVTQYDTLTDSSGDYGQLLPAGPYTVTASATGYLTATASGMVIITDTTTTLDFNLAGAFLNIDPDQISVTVDLGSSLTVPLTLTNWGVLPAVFTFTELAGTRGKRSIFTAGRGPDQ